MLMITGFPGSKSWILNFCSYSSGSLVSAAEHMELQRARPKSKNWSSLPDRVVDYGLGDSANSRLKTPPLPRPEPPLPTTTQQQQQKNSSICTCSNHDFNQYEDHHQLSLSSVRRQPGCNLGSQVEEVVSVKAGDHVQGGLISISMGQ